MNTSSNVPVEGWYASSTAIDLRLELVGADEDGAPETKRERCCRVEVLVNEEVHCQAMYCSAEARPRER